MKKSVVKYKEPAKQFSHARRLYSNGKTFLKGAEIRNNRYQDIKPVQEACSTIYLSAVEALNALFIKLGIHEDELPTTASEIRHYLSKKVRRTHLNGKLLDAFNTAYENLHIFGYYRRGCGVAMIKEGIQCARLIIEEAGRIINRKK